jgi:integrase
VSAKRRTWTGRLYLGTDPDGRERYHWLGRFPTKRERDNAVAQARVNRPWEAAGAEFTVDAFAARYLARMESGELRTRGGRRYKDSSVDTARRALDHLRRAFGGRELGSITRVEAEDWAATVPMGAVAVTVTLMGEALRAELIDRNRFLGLSRRGDGRRHERPPSEEEMVVLLEGCSALGGYAPTMRALLRFAAYTGMRPGELFALDWSDVDLERDRVRVSRRLYRGRTDLPKSNRERQIALTPPAREALIELGVRDGGPVFRGKGGHRLTQPTLTAYWQQVRARTGLEHDFYLATKHYCVWYLKVRLGLPDAVIAAQMGWAERSVAKLVETYGHAADEHRLDEINAAFQTQTRRIDDAIPLAERN